jgi:parvulin-like peptidyl-prolyl isomerase
VFAVAVCIAARYYMLDRSANAGPSNPSAPSSSRGQASPEAGRRAAQRRWTPPRSTANLKIVATVNGEDITREELAGECLTHYGEVVLDDLLKTQLIRQECQRRNITVTPAEINEKIKQLTTTYGFSVDQWLEMIEREQGRSAKEYTALVWRLLAMRKLASAQLEVTPRELQEQFDREYGPAVRARAIVCDDRNKAEQARAAAVANPDDFGRLAKEHSIDGASAGLEGLIPGGIRKHTGPKEIEQVAFQMREGQISPVIHVAGQYVILKCEGHQPPVRVEIERVKMGLVEKIKSEKGRRAVHDTLRKLQEQANVHVLLNDPARGSRMPGVAAVINGHNVTKRELAELCLEKHGKEVLAGTINRRLLVQACRQRNIAIGEGDLDAEIARAAAQRLPLKPDGSPDVEKQIAMETRGQNISEAIYRRDAVWPSVALKKLVGGRVEVTEDDIRKGFERNYGPRVRCLAIVLNDLRLAQRVFDMARRNPTREHFGELAAQYSVDPTSKALRGEVQPIAMHGGLPKLEKEAFSLRPGDLSAIVQVGQNRWVILMCEGRTQPVQVDLAEVRDLIHEEIHEKKLWLAMDDYYQQLQDEAAIVNHLAGTTHSPAERTSAPTIATRPTPRRR